MADRYFVETPIHGEQVLVSGPEAHHLAHVMRAKPGDEVILFDGSGAQFAARVERVGRAEIELTVLTREEVDRELSIPITLAVSLPKGERQRWLVEKAVELGVGRLAPVITERSSDRDSPAALKRLSRAVIEASKQCGRNRLMTISPATEFASFVTTLTPAAPGLIAHVGGPSVGKVLDASMAPLPAEIHLLVGPEGGFTDTEVRLAVARGWRIAGMGCRILRVETAALALVSAVTSRFDLR